jgi:hypothetical protein
LICSAALRVVLQAKRNAPYALKTTTTSHRFGKFERVFLTAVMAAIMKEITR